MVPPLTVSEADAMAEEIVKRLAINRVHQACAARAAGPLRLIEERAAVVRRLMKMVKRHAR